jgi:hypothetical protein
MLPSLAVLSFAATLQVPTAPVKCGKPFDVKFTSDTDSPFSLALADPSTRARWFRWPHQPPNTATRFQIPCHFSSDAFWLLIAENGEITAEASIRLSDPILDPFILSPAPNSVFRPSGTIDLALSIPSRFLGASPHSMIVRILISDSDSNLVLFDESISLLNSTRIFLTGQVCEHCTFSVFATWNQSFQLSQQIVITDEPDQTSPPFPTASSSRPDPNQSPLVMCVGIGFLLVGPLAIGLFFYINRRKPFEPLQSDILGDSLAGTSRM